MQGHYHLWWWYTYVSVCVQGLAGDPGDPGMKGMEGNAGAIGPEVRYLL